MQGQANLTQKLGTVFEKRQAIVLAEVITEAYSDLVKTSDFNELKDIVKELAVAQKRTEQRVEELAEAQKETQIAVKETQVAIKETQVAMREAQLEIKTLAKRVGETNSTVGGLGRSIAYALENEAYRAMPGLLQEKYGIEMTERFVRTHIGGEEVNLFGRGRRNGQDILIVGETKSRMDERRKKKKRKKEIFEQLREKVEAVKTAYPQIEIVQVIITHYARPGALERAKAEGIIVVQSFEW